MVDTLSKYVHVIMRELPSNHYKILDDFNESHLFNREPNHSSPSESLNWSSGTGKRTGLPNRSKERVERGRPLQAFHKVFQGCSDAAEVKALFSLILPSKI